MYPSAAAGAVVGQAIGAPGQMYPGIPGQGGAPGGANVSTTGPGGTCVSTAGPGPGGAPVGVSTTGHTSTQPAPAPAGIEESP